MNYREEIYKKYISNHTANIFHIKNIEEIKNNFLFGINIIYILDFIPFDKNIKIVDIARGNGGMVYWLQSLGCKNCYGIDISEEQVNLAKSLGIKNIIKDNFINFLKK